MSYALATDPHEVGFDSTPDPLDEALFEALGVNFLDYDADTYSAVLAVDAFQEAVTDGVIVVHTIQVVGGTLIVRGAFDGPEAHVWRAEARAPVSSNPSLSVRS